MKKWICFMAVTILCAVALTACGNSNRQQESVNVQGQEEAGDTESIPEEEERKDAAESAAEVQEDMTGSETEVQEDVA